MTDLADRLASLYDRRSLQHYARWKVRFDPMYDAVAQRLKDRDAPLIDLGCGVGLLPFYLRERGFTAPIIGIDFDRRKIELAMRAAKRYRGIDFIAGDARHELPQGYNIVLLDILHYFDPRSQQQILENVARAVPREGIVIMRQGLRDGSWRYRFQKMVDAFARAVRWMKAEHLHYPTREEIAREFHGFDGEIAPLWGGLPYNNYLFVFRRRASSGITNA
ncbi:MAG TPA: methyltransferase domain-containing protein [Vicinamibacterales bacterium]|nr:methyltransferase domain-containing protein [Vicinamibacterales bacterium]